MSTPNTSLSNSAQLDWVNLMRGIIGYTNQVATRFANAGIDEKAVQVGTAVCSSFVFRKEGQEELTESLRKLEGRSSYKKLLWFGFGIRHVVHYLTDTEQGAACVALCAALAHHYTSDHAANVMTALCHERGAPNHLVPSIERWRSLISVCEGSLAKSMFPLYFDTFTRVLDPDPSKAREPTDAKTMAEALALLGDISKQKLNSVLMVGGVECAWLAAVAERLLCLTIEILDENGKRHYRSSRRPQGPAEVTFMPETVRGDAGKHQGLVRQKYFVSSGSELLIENVDLFNLTANRISTTWDTVLRDSFPKAKDFLVQRLYQKQLAGLIRCVARKSQAYYTSSPVAAIDIDSIWWIHWKGQGCLFHPRRTGLDLLNFVSQLFPELAFVANSEDFGSIPETRSLEDSVKDIADTCGCPSCPKKSKRGVDLAPICKTRLALTLIRLILILCPVTIHESVPPSVMALRQLYNCTNAPFSGTSTRAISCHGLNLIHSLFTGADLYRTKSARVSAVCGKGVCVFYSLLRDIELSPADAMYIEVIPGQIRHGEYSCKYVIDISPGLQEHLPNPNFLKEVCTENGPGFSIELIAGKRQVDEAIEASYRFLTVDNRPVYLNTSILQEALLSSLRTGDSHLEDCNRNLEVEPGPRRWSLSESPETSSQLAPKSTQNTESSQRMSWAVVTWQAWNTPKVSGQSYQNFEIDVYRPGNVLLFLIVSYLHLKHTQGSQLPHSQKRERILVAEMADCSSCVVQQAAVAWYKATKEEQAFAAEVARFDNALKRGLIKKRGSIGSEAFEEIKFELALDLVDQDSTACSRRPWKSFFGLT